MQWMPNDVRARYLEIEKTISNVGVVFESVGDEVLVEKICVDKKVHIEHIRLTHDNREEGRGFEHRRKFSIVGTCDGSCHKKINLEGEPRDLVVEYLFSLKEKEEGRPRSHTKSVTLVKSEYIVYDEDEQPDLPSETEPRRNHDSD